MAEDPWIEIAFEDEAPVTDAIPLGLFLALNEFEPEEEAALAEALAAGEAWQGGGGASPAFTVRRAARSAAASAPRY